MAEKWNDSSLSLRLAIWKSAFYTVLENPLFGYGPSERFTAVVPILSIDHLSFTHPHNDIVAGAVSVGLLGIPLVFASILSPVWAALFSEHLTKNKLFLGISLSICVFMTANINTILFNDISAAWLSFSTFLILKLKN